MIAARENAIRNLMTSCLCLFITMGTSCSSTLSNRLDELQLLCGITQDVAAQHTFSIFKPEINGNSVDTKGLELYRLSKDGTTSSKGLSFTSSGCIKVKNENLDDTLIVHQPSTSKPLGNRILLSSTPSSDVRRVTLIPLKPYDNKSFDVWSQCGDIVGKVSQEGLYFKLIDRTSLVKDLQILKITINQKPHDEISQISTSGCFFLNKDLDGKIEVWNPLNTVYGEQAMPEKRILNTLYPIYIGPAPTDEENCMKRDIRWKWAEGTCKLKTFSDFCNRDQKSEDLKEMLRILDESYSGNNCSELESILRTSKDLTIFQRKNLPNIYALQDFDHFQILNISQNKITDLAPLIRLNSLKELYAQSNNLTTLSGLPEKAPFEILSLWDNNLSNLRGIENYRAIREFYAHNNQIEDISPLKNFNELKMLYLSDNRIEDISTVSSLKKLEELYMAYNKISNLDAVKDLSNLKKLTLSFNQIVDISPLQDLANMEVLYLWGNKVSNLAPLSKMKKLLTVYLSANRISDISVFNEIQSLDLFYAPDNFISDITPLAKQKKLRYINLINNPVSDISALKDLENIVELKMTGTQLDGLSKTTSDKCPIEAKSIVVQSYCKKKIESL